MSLEEQRRAGFEEYMEASTPAGWAWHERDEIGYLSASVQVKWELWNAALDSVEVELPTAVGKCAPNELTYEDAVSDCRTAIEAAGLKVKP